MSYAGWSLFRVWRRVETAVRVPGAVAQQAYDVILADYTLPQFNALQALAAFTRARDLDIPLYRRHRLRR